jgi:hypothetical protein
MLWLNDNRERISEEYEVTGREAQSKSGEIWRSLSEDEKKPYEDEFDALKVIVILPVTNHLCLGAVQDQHGRIREELGGKVRRERQNFEEATQASRMISIMCLLV